MPGSADLRDLRVLIVEDSELVAMNIEHMLRQAGVVVVGAVGSVPEALQIAQREPLDAAVLDIHVNGEAVFPVADELRKRGVPFVFTTGADARATPARFVETPYLLKPFDAESLRQALCHLT